MSTLPSFRRLFEQDYPEEYQELVRQLAVSINYGFEPLYELLNGKLTIASNFSNLLSEISVEVDANGKPKTNVTIKKKTSDRLEGMQVIRAENLTNPNIYPTSGIFISYTETSESIIINNIAGLPANNLFRLKVYGIR